MAEAKLVSDINLKKENTLAVVGLDFGTTYSGYGYSFRDEYNKVHSRIFSFTTWRSAEGLVTDKTPTSILFNSSEEFVSFGYEAEQTYAVALEDGKGDEYMFFSRFKMKLFRDELKDQHPIPKQSISRDFKLESFNGKKMYALKVFSESIKFLRNHFLQQCEIQGFKLMEKDIHWVLTVPAIWNDSAKQFMREAANQAGIQSALLTLAYEPEAVAIYHKETSIGKKEDEQGYSLKTFHPGQQFLVLDCGGGTVDVTSYEIQKDSRLKELDKPSGGDWGGICVNNEYKALMKAIFGQVVWETFEKTYPEDALSVEQKFEGKKRGFQETQDKKVTIAYPTTLFETFNKISTRKSIEDAIFSAGFSESVNKINDKLRFEHTVMQSFFRIHVDLIIEHIKECLNRNKTHGGHIKTILMAGGFSDCKYLYERVKSEFPKLQVICPREAVTAVLKGAVMFGHNPELITERICPRTYGIAIKKTFDQDVHLDRYKSTDPESRKTVCKDMFKILVKRGEPVTVGKSTRSTNVSPLNAFAADAKVKVYASNETHQKYITDDGIQHLGTLTVHIPVEMRRKQIDIRVTLHFGYTELFVTAYEEDTNTKLEETSFDCLF